MNEFTHTELCIVACAEAWRGNRRILGHGTGPIPKLGVGLAKLTFSRDLMLLGGWAHLVKVPLPLGVDLPAPDNVEGWLPVGTVFDLVWSGRRHAMMGAAQLDRHGNSNIACIGPWSRPTVQLVGVRGVPGNTVSHPVSYWIPNHSRRVFVEDVDMICGVGPGAAPPGITPEIRRVVTNLAVLDFGGERGTMRLVSVHPGVSVDAVVAATGFQLEIPDTVPQTRSPVAEELRIIREVLDPRGLRPEISID